MKKKRLLIALAVVLGAGACVLPWWEYLYLPIMYEEVPYPEEDEQGFFPHRLTSYRKKGTYLPGPTLVVPSQTCFRCLGNEHSECERAWKVAYIGILGDPDWLAIHEGWWDTEGISDAPHTGRISYCLCPKCHPDRQ